MKTEVGTVFVAALVFSLAHVAGLWMRAGADDPGHSRNLVQAFAYAVAVLSPAGVFLGFMWYRTKNLLLVVLLHALVDVLAFTPVFARLWL
jgi:membrane protease YdiL (CAAX protease family)